MAKKEGMMKQVDVTERVYDRIVLRAGPKRSLSEAIEGLLNTVERIEEDRRKLKAWVDASEVEK